MKILFQRWARVLIMRRRSGILSILCGLIVVSFMIHFRRLYDKKLEYYIFDYSKLVITDISLDTTDNEKLISNGSMQPMHNCPNPPPGLGTTIQPPEIEGNYSESEMMELSSNLDSYDIWEGGWWHPDHCQSIYNVAIIIPYRDREENLRVLLHYLHPMLHRQLLHYRIFLAEQEGKGTYNKGRIMNSAFRIIQNLFPVYNCFIFHDVDMVPEDDRNLYMCSNQPRHLSPAVDKFNYTLPYKELIGGVLAVTVEQFQTVNGYANVFWGWGGEDDDMYYRIKARKYQISRPSLKFGRYSMLQHVQRTWISHSKTYQLLGRWRQRQKVDGVNSVQFELISVNATKHYTRLLIGLGEDGPS